jgi:hypothetical protein
MARLFLRGIRLEKKEELRERINKYFGKTNREPAEFTWEYKMNQMP